MIKMVRASVLTIIVCAVLPALAAEGEVQKRRGHGGSFCSSVQFDDTQKESIKGLYESYKEASQAKREEHKQAQAAYVAVLENSAGTQAEAEEALKVVLQVRSELMAGRSGLKNQVYYEVATPEQRVQIADCLKKRGERRRGPKKDKGKPAPGPQEDPQGPQDPQTPQPEEPGPQQGDQEQPTGQSEGLMRILFEN